ncbi:MAG: hypothetical protein ABSA70_07965 [Terriglobia bacterium]
MDRIATQPTSPRTIGSRWLWGLRLATGVFLLFAMLPTFMLLHPDSGKWIVDEAVFAFLALPAFYALALWFLRGNPPHKFGLALAVSSGTVWSVLCLIGVIASAISSIKGSGYESLVFVAVTTVQGAYGATAARAYFRLGWERADWGRLASGLAVAVLVVAFLAWNLPYALRTHRGGYVNRPSPVGSLRAINTAEIAYIRTYNRGFSPNLAVLGPPPPGKQPTETTADLIDEVLASGVKIGYRFSYRPGARGVKGQIWSYTVCAQPIKRSENFLFSYSTDETGVIRQTQEDRCPTSQDPALGG